MEDRSKRTETARPPLNERCERRQKCDSVLSATNDENDVELNGDRQTDTSPTKTGHSSLNMGLEWHGYHSISDTEASALAPAVGQPSKSAGCLAVKKKLSKKKKNFIGVDKYHVFAESQYHRTMKSDPDAEPEKLCRVPVPQYQEE